MSHKRNFFLKFFRVIWEEESAVEAELVPRLNRQLSLAVERNRIKRVLREFFRKHREVFPPGRWVFIAKPKVERSPNREVFADLENLLSRLPRHTA